MRRLSALCGLACAALLAGCGSATAHLNFSVPAGYQSKMNLFGTEMWMKGTGNDTSLIMLMKLPTKVDLKKFTPTNLSSAVGAKGGTVQSSQRIAICGNGQPAILLKMIATESKDAQRMAMSSVVTGVGNTTYMAMYARPIGVPDDAQAESAIRGICVTT